MELVHSVDDLKSSLSKKETHGPNFELLDARTASSLYRIIKNTCFNKVSLGKQKDQEKDRFLKGRSLSWSTCTSGSLEPMVLSRIMPTYLQLVFEMMIFRNSIRNETKFLINDANPVWWHLGRIVQIKNMSVWYSRPYWNCMTWRVIRRNANQIITDWRRW